MWAINHIAQVLQFIFVKLYIFKNILKLILNSAFWKHHNLGLGLHGTEDIK